MGKRFTDKEAEMRCPHCKGQMVKGYTSMPYELDENHFIVIRRVPALVCTQCSEPFIEMPVAREIEKLVEDAEKKGMVLGVIQYSEAA